MFNYFIWLISAVGYGAIIGLIFYAGYLMGKYSKNNNEIEQKYFNSYKNKG